MRQTRVPVSVGPLFLLMFLLVTLVFTPVLYGESAPAASPARGPAVPTEPQGQHWWLCRYRVLKDASQPVLGSLMYYALIVSGDATPNNMAEHFVGYVRQNYPAVKDVTVLQAYCARSPDDAPGRANAMDMLQQQWASSHTEAINIKWTDSPAENAAIDANAASAAAAAAVPTAAATQRYVFCQSEWAPATSDATGTVMYVSDVFPADMPPALTRTGGHPLPPNANSAQINRISALQASFFAFLQKRYGYEDSGGYPVSCAAGFPPTAGGLQSAQHDKQTTEDGVKQRKGQVVETGWKDQ